MSEIADSNTPVSAATSGVFYPLRRHPTNAAPMIGVVEAAITHVSDAGLSFYFRLRGDISRLRLPAEIIAERSDLLWQHTCCEVFIGPVGDPGYREFNFSPSGRWAAYDFSDYRQRLPDPPLESPHIASHITEGRFELIARVPAVALPPLAAADHFEIGLAVIVEAKDTVNEALSYWALHHDAARPDFHRREGFVLRWTNP